MTLAADDAPAIAVDPPEVAAVAGMLRQLWPTTMTELMALQHARTFVRINERHYGPADPAVATRVGALLAPAQAPGEGVPDDTCIEVRGGLFLRKWVAGMDRRPGPGRWDNPAWQPGGELYRQHTGPHRGFFPGAAKHGECTSCVKSGELRRAVYRLSDANDTYSRSSLCSRCARTMLGGPVVVPRFNTPEEAQAWLDANGD